MKLIRPACALLAALSLFALSSTAAAQQTQLTKLRAGVIPIYDTLPLWVGRDEGFFKAEGIELELVPTTGGGTAIPAMEGGSLDLAYADIGTVFRASQQGLALKIVAPAGTVSLDPVKDGAHFLSASEGGVNSLADVKGKKIAVNALRNLVNLYVMAALDAKGIPPGSYTVVELPYPQMPDALLNKQVDLVYEVEPFVTILKNTGKVKDLGSATYTIHSNLRFASYVVSERWLKKNEELARKFQRAYARSVELVTQNADKHGDWQVKYFRLNPELKSQVASGKFQDIGMGADYMASLNKTKNLMLKYKYLEADFDPQTLIYR